jgi:hypothetical protein
MDCAVVREPLAALPFTGAGVKGSGRCRKTPKCNLASAVALYLRSFVVLEGSLRSGCTNKSQNKTTMVEQGTAGISHLRI